jgi:hypothetical protein
MRVRWNSTHIISVYEGESETRIEIGRQNSVSVTAKFRPVYDDEKPKY